MTIEGPEAPHHVHEHEGEHNTEYKKPEGSIFHTMKKVLEADGSKTTSNIAGSPKRVFVGDEKGNIEKIEIGKLHKDIEEIYNRSQKGGGGHYEGHGGGHH